MLNEVTVLNIREYLAATENGRFGEEELKELLSEFSCSKNADVERFLKEQAIEFTKKNRKTGETPPCAAAVSLRPAKAEKSGSQSAGIFRTISAIPDALRGTGT